MSVKDKVVIITGAARGHGRSIAVTFASEGARLALVDIAPTDQVAQECQAHEAEVLGIQTDLRDPEQVRAMVERVMERYGRIDVLINDAGIVTHFRYGEPRWSRIAEMDPSFFDSVIRTNLYGTFLTTHFVLPHMEAQGSGHIINFGQGSVGRGIPSDAPGAAAYHVSKVAIRAFTQEVAAEERDRGICIMSFGPGGPGGDQARADAMTPEEVRAVAAQIDTNLGQRVVMLAEAPMEFTGRMVTVRDGALAFARDEVS
jgi:NAD(P)-dependent dehydrogenase (short-subunit alcohol dehydrogenase family)